jgi:hypothetical protein
MQRIVGRLVEAPLASSILSGDLPGGCTVELRGEGALLLLLRRDVAAA